MRHTINIDQGKSDIKSIVFSDENGYTMDLTPSEEKQKANLAIAINWFKPGYETPGLVDFLVEESESSVKIKGNIDKALQFLEKIRLLDKVTIFKIRTDNKLEYFLKQCKEQVIIVKEYKAEAKEDPNQPRSISPIK